jgi:hypothetical protein
MLEYENTYPLFSQDSTINITNYVMLRNYLIIFGINLTTGVSNVWCVTLENEDIHQIAMPEESYCIEYTCSNYQTNECYITYDSLITPLTIFEIKNGQELLRIWQRNVPHYDKECFKSERIMARARDGTFIPVSIVYRSHFINSHGIKTQRIDEPMPMLLDAYGHYGKVSETQFIITRLPLLDHGVCYAIAHIRGGGELGKTWHKQAIRVTKEKTYTDFIDVARTLIVLGKTTSQLLAIKGASAGGLLCSVVLNKEPFLFKVAVIDKPAIDVLMFLKSELPQQPEWGNPNTLEEYYAIRKYSPLHNIHPAPYPTMLIRTGWNDSRTPFSDGIKYTTLIREAQEKWYKNKGVSYQPALLKVDYSEGHFAANINKVRRNDVELFAFVMHYLEISIRKTCIYKNIIDMFDIAKELGSLDKIGIPMQINSPPSSNVPKVSVPNPLQVSSLPLKPPLIVPSLQVPITNPLDAPTLRLPLKPLLIVPSLQVPITNPLDAPTLRLQPSNLNPFNASLSLPNSTQSVTSTNLNLTLQQLLNKPKGKKIKSTRYKLKSTRDKLKSTRKYKILTANPIL